MQSWKERREHLAKLIKEVSDHHGGDDPAWLEQYIKEVVQKNYNDLDTAIAAFESAHPDYQRKAYMAQFKGA